ncbi:hypothetical protein N7509_008139 [Penicillium cosmopolitanum]|uniref:Uncharacterized protein n=1 Tax=Penicillium cosmopolitanum TaxID=1131564 RepID=A0A9W9W0A5_9EURO|nr:uncharacterized protein N7509_008139 [Penicillium cosmopolitanum]KAJ5392649.1 hypothetical protein N7509_008139 [Penicillium cosmopolitanum]
MCDSAISITWCISTGFIAIGVVALRASLGSGKESQKKAELETEAPEKKVARHPEGSRNAFRDLMGSGVSN